VWLLLKVSPCSSPQVCFLPKQAAFFRQTANRLRPNVVPALCPQSPLQAAIILRTTPNTSPHKRTEGWAPPSMKLNHSCCDPAARPRKPSAVETALQSAWQTPDRRKKLYETRAGYSRGFAGNQRLCEKVAPSATHSRGPSPGDRVHPGGRVTYQCPVAPHTNTPSGKRLRLRRWKGRDCRNCAPSRENPFLGHERMQVAPQFLARVPRHAAAKFPTERWSQRGNDPQVTLEAAKEFHGNSHPPGPAQSSRGSFSRVAFQKGTAYSAAENCVPPAAMTTKSASIRFFTDRQSGRAQPSGRRSDSRAKRTTRQPRRLGPAREAVPFSTVLE